MVQKCSPRRFRRAWCTPNTSSCSATVVQSTHPHALQQTSLSIFHSAGLFFPVRRKITISVFFVDFFFLCSGNASIIPHDCICLSLTTNDIRQRIIIEHVTSLFSRQESTLRVTQRFTPGLPDSNNYHHRCSEGKMSKVTKLISISISIILYFLGHFRPLMNIINII